MVAIFAGEPNSGDHEHLWATTSWIKSFWPLYVVIIEMREAGMPCTKEKEGLEQTQDSEADPLANICACNDVRISYSSSLRRNKIPYELL